MKIFSGRVAVVTGAASGIGLALAERFAREGMNLVLADINGEQLNQVAHSLRVRGRTVLAVRTDVANARSVAALAKKTFKVFGAVHILCNNAGVNPQGGRYAAPWQVSLDDWKWAIDVNLWGVIHGIRSFVPSMIAGGDEGHIVNTASISGMLSGASGSIYGMTKHAIVRVSEGVYASLQDAGAKIGTTVLCPGAVRTAIRNSEQSSKGDLEPPVDTVAARLRDKELSDEMMRRAISPDEVADQTIEAITENRFYVLTTSAYDDAIRSRMEAILERRNPVFLSGRELASRDGRIK